MDEQRVNEVVWREHVLPDHRPHGRVLAVAARARALRKPKVAVVVQLFLRMFFLVEYISSFQLLYAARIVRNIFGTEYSIEHVHE